MGNKITQEQSSEQIQTSSDEYSLTKKMLFTSKMSDTFYQKMKLNNIKINIKDIPTHFLKNIIETDNVDAFQKMENLIDDKTNMCNIMIDGEQLYNYLIINNAKNIISHLNVKFNSSNVPMHLLKKNSGRNLSLIFERYDNKKEFLNLKYGNRKIIHIYIETRHLLSEFVKYIDLSEKCLVSRLSDISNNPTIAHVCFYDGDIDTIKEIIKCDKKSIFVPDSDGYTPFDLYLIRYCTYTGSTIQTSKLNEIEQTIKLMSKSDFFTLFNNKTKIDKTYSSIYGNRDNDSHYSYSFDKTLKTIIPKGSTFLDIINCFDNHNKYHKNTNVLNIIQETITKIMESDEQLV